MEKLQYLVWLPELTPRSAVKPLMIDQVAPRLLAEGILGLTMDLDDDDADVTPPVPAPEGENVATALVSVWVDCYDRRAGLEKILRDAAVRVDGYQVLESLYTDYGTSKWAKPRDWPDGQRSPGILTVATFEQPPGTDFEEWLSFWHGHQSPMSEAIQPRCRYVRNLVVRPLERGNPPWQGHRGGGVAERRACDRPDAVLLRWWGPRRHVCEHHDNARSRDKADRPEHIAEHDHERVDHEDSRVRDGPLQPGGACCGARPFHRGCRPMCADHESGANGRSCSRRTPSISSTPSGDSRAVSEIYDWIQPLMNQWPNSEMVEFPHDWCVLDEERGWWICQIENRFRDPGDGSVHQAHNLTVLHYAGDGLLLVRRGRLQPGQLRPDDRTMDGAVSATSHELRPTKR